MPTVYEWAQELAVPLGVTLWVLLGASTGGRSTTSTAEIQVQQTSKPESREPLKRLTAEDVTKLLSVEPQIRRVARERRHGGYFELHVQTPMDVALAGARLDADGEIRRVLDRYDWTGREYLLTLFATLSAMSGELPFFAEPGTAWAANKQLLRHPPDELVEPLARWKATLTGMPDE